MDRRRFLGVAGCAVVGTGGCLGKPTSDEGKNNDEVENNNGVGEEATCEFEEGSWYGEGEPIETRVTLESEPEDDIEQVCASAAADAAVNKLNAQTDIELEEQNWIHAGWYFDGEYGASVRVNAVQGRHGNNLRCPDPRFEVSKARAVLPGEVTVTLHLEDSGETYRCTHKIRFQARTMYLD